MYLAEVPPAPAGALWDLPFDERMALLRRGRPRAAYFYTHPDTSTFRYRVYNVAQSLGASARERGSASASWFHASDFDAMPRVLDACDVLVFGRNSLYTDRVARIADLARTRGRRILFDVDDLVFDPAYVPLLMDTLGADMLQEANWNYWYSYVGRIGAAFALCDGAIVTNLHLARHAEAWSGKPARIIPNYLNREQQAISDRVWAAKEGNGWARDGRLHLGYFSGSPSHDRDFAIVAPTLARLMHKFPDLRLRVVGFLNLGPDLARLGDRVEQVPLQDFVDLQREVGAVEVNLVPLQQNTFTHCKSELKWFEAAVVGALTFASPIFSYGQVVHPGSNGWLAQPHEWEGLLRTVIGEVDAWRAAVAPAAREEARERYGWDRQEATIRDALFDGG
jgi:glycosyltransferase involved in cell wall biosynthesis